MANDYFAKSGNPSANSLGDSSLIRAEITALEAAFDKLAGLTGNGDKIVVINTGGTGQTVKTAAELKTLLGLVIGTNVQAQDATLQSLSALGTAADKLAYTTGVDTWAEAILTSVARTLLAQTTQALMRTTGLGATAIGDALFLAATAAAAQTALGIIIKRKTADESVTSSTTLQDDDHLTFPIGANEEWVADFDIGLGDTLGVTGVQLSVTTPSGSIMEADATFVTSGNAQAIGGHIISSGNLLIGFTPNSGALGHISGGLWVLNGATPGNVTITWAQNALSGTALIFKKGSHMVAHRIA
jgi:hypothetical protein